MLKTCYCGLKSNRKFCNYVLIMSLLAYIFVKRNLCMQKGHCRCTFSSATTIIKNVQVNLSMYKASILENKQLLSSMIDQKAIQVTYTTSIVFLTNSYIFCLNFPAILAVPSYIVIWSSTFEHNLKVASYLDF